MRKARDKERYVATLQLSVCRRCGRLMSQGNKSEATSAHLIVVLVSWLVPDGSSVGCLVDCTVGLVRVVLLKVAMDLWFNSKECTFVVQLIVVWVSWFIF
jgi:hypothetical protein